ncbi:MAG: hypothetical protein EON54_08380 [Alcaligenaceae bacterium]|nr:MAG: hypothetical protein EON54_08380 [Alcaligenaceae bacterium]
MLTYQQTATVGTPWPESPHAPYTARNPHRWLKRTTRICAIGSCFATNFSRWISQQGVPVISPPWGLHYNSATIRDELDMTEAHTKLPIYWEVVGKDGAPKFLDAKRHPISAGTLGSLVKHSQRLEAQAACALETADAFIITLGLSEIWEQRIGNQWHVINRAPPLALREQANSVFRTRYQSVDEIVKDLRRIVESIDTDVNHHRPITFTVSPVPLKTTGSGLDPRVANMRSKAILLTALHEFLDTIEPDRRPHLSYFPSFEQFFHVEPGAQIWQSDGRHITAGKIDSVCRSFCEMYGADDEENFPSLPDFEVPSV